MYIALLARKTLFSQPGGDTVQIVETAAALERRGNTVQIVRFGEALHPHTSILHVFNVGRPNDAYPYWDQFKGKKILSTVYVDYSSADRNRFPRLFKLFGAHGVEYFKTLARWRNKSDGAPDFNYLIRGQKRSMVKLLEEADAFITSSYSELERIKQDCISLSGKNLRDRHHVVPLGVPQAFLSAKRPSASNRAGLLMVGRLEYLKNQKRIIELATQQNWPLSVIGSANVNQPEYYEACVAAAGPTVKFFPHSDEAGIIAAMDLHAVLLIPSFFESFSLVGLEAAARGMQVIANDVADMNETLAAYATFVDFSDEQAIVGAVEQRLVELGHKKSQAIRSEHTWDHIALKLEEVYA